MEPSQKAYRAARIKEVFKQYDADGDGSINMRELSVVLKSLGNFKDVEIFTIFSHIDTNGDGKVQFGEFVDWLTGGTKRDLRAKVALAPSMGEGLEMPFINFCGADHSEMDCRSFTKMCKDLQFIDKHFSANDTDLIFSKVATKGKRRIALSQFEDALKLVAEGKGLSVEEVRERVIESTQPTFRGTRAHNVRFHERSSRAQRESASSDVPDGIDRRTRSASRSLEPAGRSTVASARSPPRHGSGAAGNSRVDSPTQQPQTMAPRAPEHLPALSPRGPRTYKEVFRAFCGAHGDLDSAGFMKLCRHCHLLDESFKATDVDVLFTKVHDRGQRRINIKQFEEALYQMAEKKGKSYGELLEAVASSHGPVVNGTHGAAPRLHGSGQGSLLSNAAGR
mmetsp:Transcript_57897/g.134901  ORF Transcript_57897/g.134901 Transcript_57897/m.134901 type:complete len:394 (-) Transcript_57897:90-1271(-)